MKRGDKIVSVNGIDLSRATHEDAAIALKNAGNTVALRLFYSPEDYERFEAKIHSIKNQVRWRKQRVLNAFSVGNGYTGPESNVCTWLRACCKQVYAEVVATAGTNLTKPCASII